MAPYVSSPELSTKKQANGELLYRGARWVKQTGSYASLALRMVNVGTGLDLQSLIQAFSHTLKMCQAYKIFNKPFPQSFFLEKNKFILWAVLQSVLCMPAVH